MQGRNDVSALRANNNSLVMKMHHAFKRAVGEKKLRVSTNNKTCEWFQL
jgi:hypothetical protein